MITEKIIKENLKREIENSYLSKSQIAAKLGISKPTLSQYLSGRIMPSLVTFANLCEILDISADELLQLKK